MKFLLLFVAILGCSSRPTMTEPAPATHPAPATGSGTEPAPAPTDPSAGSAAAQDGSAVPPSGGAKLGEPCGVDGSCGQGACVTYYGIAGPRGPAFKSCEIKCSDKSPCPQGLTCRTIADGPGSVCR